MANVDRRRRALVVLHQAHSTPGRVGMRLQAIGCELDIRRPSLGDALPPTLEDHDGVIIFGGPMCANDSDAWIRREIDWIGTPLRERKPFLGLCLGAQMLARQLGAKIFSYPDSRCESGYYPISPTPAGHRLCGAPFPNWVYQWHSDGFQLPSGAELLAQGGADFPNQAFRYAGNAVGLQFHPEVTYQMMCRWTTRGAARLDRPGARAPHEHLEGWRLHDRPVDAWLDAFLMAWLTGGLSEQAAPRSAQFPAASRQDVQTGAQITPSLAAASPSV